MRKKIAGTWLKFIAFLLLCAAAAVTSKSTALVLFAVCAAGLSLVSAVFTFFIAKKVVLSFDAPPSCGKNASPVIRLDAVNGSKLPLGRLLCTVLAENRLCGESEEILLETSACGRDKGSASFELASEHCGHMALSVKKAYITDWLGLFMKRIDSSASGEMSVLPDTFLPQIDISIPPLTPFDDESYSPDKKGYDLSEVFQLREYEEQDSLRQIHWKLSDKLDKLIVRDGSLPVAKNILVFWDKHTRDAEPKEADAMAEVFCSVCQGLCDLGVKYTLGYSTQQGCSLEEIEGAQELLDAIPSMLKEPCKGDVLSGTEKYAQEYGKAIYGKVICLCAAFPEGIDIFASGSLSLISLDETGSTGYTVINFGTENYDLDLMTMEL